jgi:Spy/CpxP family protein refolding chaperone
MNRTGKRIALVVSGLVLVTGLTACGHRFGHHGPGDKADWMVNKVTAELKLDEAQQAKLKAIKDELLSVRKEWVEQREESRSTALALLDKPALDRQQAIDLINGHTQFVEQKAPEIVAAVGEFYDSLTPEQQQTLREHVQKRMEHRGGHHWGRD